MNPLPPAKPERPAQRETRPEREPRGEGVIGWEYGRLFAQYVEGGSGQGGFASRLPGQVTSVDEVMVQSLSEQLALRLSGVSQWPLQMALYMPRLGRINVSARREHASWDITLHAEEAATSRWLAGVRQHCEDRLGQTLGQPVCMHVAQVDET